MPTDPAAIRRRVGANLRSGRLALGLTLAQLSERTGISTSHLSNTESGTYGLTVEKLHVLCRALYLSPDAVMGTWGEGA